MNLKEYATLDIIPAIHALGKPKMRVYASVKELNNLILQQSEKMSENDYG